MGKILVMGSLGQIGSELLVALREIYGHENVIASDIKNPETQQDLQKIQPFELHDCTDKQKTKDLVSKYQINIIYNLPAILSARAENMLRQAFDINLIGTLNTLEVAKEYNCTIFTPSTIGVFGSNTPKDNTPQHTIMRPNTMYGITKVAGELLADYYHNRFGIDTRGLRYPGVISNKALTGGGTTDYAVEIFHEAIINNKYVSYLKADTRLDMVYMPDAITATIQLMQADGNKLKDRNAFNITAMNFSVEELGDEIKKHIPNFELSYKIDPVRQKIADSWPNKLDDTCARKQWGWNPKYKLETMVIDMLDKLNQ